MKTSSVSSHPHLEHLFKIGVLAARQGHIYPQAVRDESTRELARYRDEGLSFEKLKEDRMSDRIPMTKSGHCTFESPGSHATCSGEHCDCSCHDEQKAFSGQGILFAVIDDREAMRVGKVTTIDIIADAIEAALDAGHETSEEIARYLTTSAFQHIPDKRVRFNSVLKAGDTVGAQIVRKLHNAYNDLLDTAEEERGAVTKARLLAEAQGFAEAMQVVLSPFSVEDETEPQYVAWDELDHLTELFQQEQSDIRNAKKKAGTRR